MSSAAPAPFGLHVLVLRALTTGAAGLLAFAASVLLSIVLEARLDPRPSWFATALLAGMVSGVVAALAERSATPWGEGSTRDRRAAALCFGGVLLALVVAPAQVAYAHAALSQGPLAGLGAAQAAALEFLDRRPEQVAGVLALACDVALVAAATTWLRVRRLELGHQIGQGVVFALMGCVACMLSLALIGMLWVTLSRWLPLPDPSSTPAECLAYFLGVGGLGLLLVAPPLAVLLPLAAAFAEHLSRR